MKARQCQCSTGLGINVPFFCQFIQPVKYIVYHNTIFYFSIFCPVIAITTCVSPLAMDVKKKQKSWFMSPLCPEHLFFFIRTIILPYRRIYDISYPKTNNCSSAFLNNNRRFPNPFLSSLPTQVRSLSTKYCFLHTWRIYPHYRDLQ